MPQLTNQWTVPYQRHLIVKKRKKHKKIPTFYNKAKCTAIPNVLVPPTWEIYSSSRLTTFPTLVLP